MQLLELIVAGAEGLHARPAAELVRISQSADAEISIGRAGQARVPASSMLSMLALGLRHGERIEVSIAGESNPELERQIRDLFSA